jgi:hypothetical protein
MQPTKPLLSLLHLLVLLPLALCATKRTAYVTVVNHTPYTLNGVGLLHKYSNVYADKCVWEKIPPGKESSRCQVSYNTGILTTGKDWWRIFGHSDRDPILHNSLKEWYSDPDNFRGFFDWLDRAAPGIIGAALEVAGFVNPQLKPVSAVARVVADAICGALLNDGKTAGYKQHILRKQDQGVVTRVYVQNDGHITLASPSGNSKTDISTAVVKLRP